MQVHLAEHLPKKAKIQLGGYYTPKVLVNKVSSFIKPYLENNKKETIIFDNAGGCGAFLMDFRHYDYRIADCDLNACNFLKQYFNRHRVFYTNSLGEVRRDKYSIPSSAFLIMIGNPPYNDITSEFKKGEKGENTCDDDLFDRDLGISFLKSYHKLKANVVCVLHPLSYLIKEANFKRLCDFKDNYRLIKAEIFPSDLFRGTGKIKFPILVALYEKNPLGMTFEYIKQFQFDILNSDKKLVLSKYNTTDGYINKYPPRKNDIKNSPLGLYYYSFRDFNSLKKNASFITKKHPNGIVVTLDNFYKYAYLYSLKSLFNPESLYLYGNMSPLVNIDDVEGNKGLYVFYTIKTNKVFREINESILNNIKNYCKAHFDKNYTIDMIAKEIQDRLNKLIE
jgi:hypothetical protein